MSNVATIYAQALYDLVKEEERTDAVLSQITALEESFSKEPNFIRLLGTANLTKAERCQVLDNSFRGRVDQNLLNFMKILTEKGYMRHFSDCRKAFLQLYNSDHGILEVKAVTAVALTQDQKQRLCEKLAAITGKTVSLHNSIDPACLGGIRLDYDGKRVDDTVQHRLDKIRTLLSDTVL